LKNTPSGVFFVVDKIFELFIFGSIVI